MENFRDMAEEFLDAHAGVQVKNGQQLGKVWVQLIEDSVMRERMGKAGRAICEGNRGATERSLERIAAIVSALDSEDGAAEPGEAAGGGKGNAA
jgi:3-deoxy-D-manno-octulosonic-acid transferase